MFQPPILNPSSRRQLSVEVAFGVSKLFFQGSKEFHSFNLDMQGEAHIILLTTAFAEEKLGMPKSLEFIMIHRLFRTTVYMFGC